MKNERYKHSLDKLRLLRLLFISLFDSKISSRLVSAYAAIPIIIETASDFDVQRIVLFGSVARGQARYSSDIDLMTTSEYTLDDDIRIRMDVAIDQTLASRGFKKPGNHIHVTIVSEEQVNCLPDPDSTNFKLIQDIQEQGITIYRRRQ